MSRAGRLPSSLLPQRRWNNLALVPGNLLVHKAAWQIAASRLPAHAILIVLPEQNTIHRQTLLTVARLLAQRGRHVRVISAPDIVLSESR